jgi:hypothetical protein
MHTQGILIIFLCILRTAAQTTLSGDVGGRTFGSSGNPYIVTDNITVPPNKTTAIEAGCVFLFKPFTGINIDGTLTVSGTQQKPVVFTTVQDGKHNPKAEQMPNPFDWNGIFIATEANNVRLSHFILSYSVFGIKSEHEGIVIENGIFRQNGQFHFTINGAIQMVQDDFPFSYNTDKGIKNRARREHVRPLKAAALGGGAVGLVAGGISLVYWGGYKDAWNEAEKATSADAIAAANDREKEALVKAGVFSGAAALLVPAALVMYFVDRAKQDAEKTVTLYPVVSPKCAGLDIQYEF